MPQDSDHSIPTTEPLTEQPRRTTEDKAIDVIERLLACLPAPEYRSEWEIAAAERVPAAIARLRMLRDDRRGCGGWADLSHG